MYVPRMTYAICFVKHFWISLFIFLKYVEGYEIKNYCVTSSLILYLFNVLNSTQRYGCREAKEIWEVKGAWKGSVLRTKSYLPQWHQFICCWKISMSFMMTGYVGVSKPMDNRNYVPICTQSDSSLRGWGHNNLKVPHITVSASDYWLLGYTLWWDSLMQVLKPQLRITIKMSSVISKFWKQNPHPLSS